MALRPNDNEPAVTPDTAPTVDTLDPANASDEAKEMVAAGAVPQQVDVNALLAQLQALQARVQVMEAEKGIPSDPVAAAHKNLYDHVKTRQHMHALYPEAFAETLKVLDQAKEDGLDALTADDVAYIRECVDGLPSTVEGKDYLQELAHDLRGAVRKVASK